MAKFETLIVPIGLSKTTCYSYICLNNPIMPRNFLVSSSGPGPFNIQGLFKVHSRSLQILLACHRSNMTCTPKMTEGQKTTVKWPKMHFFGQNRKKVKKADPPYF